MESNIEMRFLQIQTRIARAIERRPDCLTSDVRLVAVSKYQSIEDICALYQCGQRVFGENYIKELLNKSNDIRIREECPDIKWRFIGNLQRNKTNQLMRVHNLNCLESLDSLNLAQTLNKACDSTLEVMIQINTSGEQNKSGIHPQELIPLVETIGKECPKLEIKGLMTIGRQNHDWNEGPNPDFQTIISCGQELREKSGKAVELSFGMSDDFERAIEMGSNEVRIGTALFGQRNK